MAAQWVTSAPAEIQTTHKIYCEKRNVEKILSIKEIFGKILEKEISKLSRPLDSLWTSTFLSPARLKAAPTLIIDYRTRLICSQFSLVFYLFLRFTLLSFLFHRLIVMKIKFRSWQMFFITFLSFFFCSI